MKCKTFLIALALLFTFNNSFPKAAEDENKDHTTASEQPRITS